MGKSQIYRPFSTVYREPSPANRKLLFFPFTPIYLCFIKPKQTIKLKATTIIIIAVLSLQVSILFAGNTYPPITPNKDASASCCVSLVTTSPAVAIFKEDATLTDYTGLAPVAPMEVDFNDDVDLNDAVMIQSLAPVTPLEADFNDDFYLTVDFCALTPTTPAEADFE